MGRVVLRRNVAVFCACYKKGNFFAVFFMFFYDRKLSLPRKMSVVNGIYKSKKPEDDKLYLHEVTEYSEIPDSEVLLLLLSSLL